MKSSKILKYQSSPGVFSLSVWKSWVINVLNIFAILLLLQVHFRAGVNSVARYQHQRDGFDLNRITGGKPSGYFHCHTALITDSPGPEHIPQCAAALVIPIRCLRDEVCKVNLINAILP